MKKRKFGMYSLAIGAFALAITGCGGKNEQSSEAPAPAAGAPAGKMVDAATAGEVTPETVARSPTSWSTLSLVSMDIRFRPHLHR